jgi:hypothetical protein
MTENDDIEKLRTLLRAEAQNAPLGRERKDSKAAKVRALYPDLLAIKKRLPHATLADLTKMLQNIGLDVKRDSVARVMRSEQAARPGVKPSGKAPIPRVRKTAVAIIKSSDVPPTAPIKAKPDSDHAIFRRNPNDPI